MFHRHKWPLDLSTARILISNDDGVDAAGIKVLERIARKLGREVWVMAPEAEQSAASHSLTLRVPLRIRKHAARRYSVNGTPTDAVLLAINHVMKDHPPDLVLSGINRGANLGEDVTYSGTIAAAMEGTLLGVPSIALSLLVKQGHPAKWHTAESHAPALIRRLCRRGWPRNVLININFPDVLAGAVKGARLTRQGRRKIGDHLSERVDPRGQPYYWIGPMRSEEPSKPGTDLAAVNAGAIAVTPFYLDLTHGPTLRHLKKAFD